MCGRYTFFSSQDDLEQYFEAIVSQQGSIIPNTNVTPGSHMPVVAIGRDGAPVIPVFRWGLIPSWAKEAKIGYKMINARSESVLEKPSFRPLMAQRRCIIPANGFYEWKKLETGGKQPYLIHREGDKLLGFAGLYDRWRSPEGEDVFTYTIITTQANRKIAGIHDRMPVILPKSTFRTWLDNRAGTEAHLALLKPAPDDTLSFREEGPPDRRSG